MNVHNLMEDTVTKAVNALYDRVKADNIPWLTCDCENCRLDTVSYVLNRIPPKYVVSGRGVTHNVEYLASSQLQADVDSLALEGMRTVSSTKRPFHSENRKDCTIHGDETPTVYGAYFNHESETAGLGAEIKDSQAWQEKFIGKKVFVDGSQDVALSVVKNVEDPTTQVDCVTGATLTSNGVNDMIKAGLKDAGKNAVELFLKMQCYKDEPADPLFICTAS